MRFNAITDIDVELLKERSYAEAAEIFVKESTRGNRTIEDVRAATMYGHAAEVYLIQHHNFKDDPRPFKDLFNTIGKPVEVKVTEFIHYVPHVIRRCEEYAREKWRQYPAIVYIFIGNKSSLEYNLYGIYHWNGSNFIKEKE